MCIGLLAYLYVITYNCRSNGAVSATALGLALSYPAMVIRSTVSTELTVNPVVVVYVDLGDPGDRGPVALRPAGGGA